MPDPVRPATPGVSPLAASPSSCSHMISLAQKRGVRRHPISGQFWVKKCARKHCRALIPVEMPRCCYCGGNQFKDMDQTIRIDAGICRYYCRGCRKFTTGCDTKQCVHCQSTDIVLANPILHQAE